MPQNLSDEELNAIKAEYLDYGTRREPDATVADVRRLLAHIAAVEATNVQHDLKMLVKVAAREQRYACVDTFNKNAGKVNLHIDIHNTPCPDVADVLSKWRAMIDRRTEVV